MYQTMLFVIPTLILKAKCKSKKVLYVNTLGTRIVIAYNGDAQCCTGWNANDIIPGKC